MRVLFVTIPWRSHLHLLVPMGWALQTAGHEVRVASGPELADVITRSGLTAVPVGSDEPVLEKLERLQDAEVLKKVEELAERGDLLVDMSENREEELTWERLRWAYRMYRKTHAAMNDSMVEELVEYCRWWKPDLVVWDWLSYAGSIAATAVGAAHARMPIGLNVEAQMRAHYLRVREQQAPQDREDPLGDWLGEWARKFGASFHEEMVTGQFTVDQMVGSLLLESDVPRLPIGYVPYNGPSVEPDWTRADPAKPRVLATFGVSLEQAARHQALTTEQLQGMLDAVAGLDIELVLTLPEQLQKELVRVPDNTRMVEFVPLHVIIPSCSAVLHHGGIGPFLDSIVHEVPQLMVSRVLPDIGERGPRMEQAGAGLWIPGDDPEELSGERIRDHLVRLLEEPSFREGAGRLRAELLAQPTPAEAVRELERLADGHRSR
ncbi:MULTISPECIES: activator-dependent family glycosyltransferase [Streptomyces]|uniref:activator-dependent family glycosyltransferase n=1 Tax=Streptomyces TaxID=1883 RepID=UPI001E28B6E6|nr:MULTISPECIES: activator-dependent family glycosyltransferase [Streptomyces]UFQ18666.1 activator-dependent family glycosyltransferase [Streptomyces huasconensis]WCL88281.1 activator-dependent family glycosyltransferase [Streptomyces sp. JCM 35825]